MRCCVIAAHLESSRLRAVQIHASEKDPAAIAAGLAAGKETIEKGGTVTEALSAQRAAAEQVAPVKMPAHLEHLRI